MQPPHLVILGSSNTDLVVVCERFPKPGETLRGTEFHQFAGGKGANQAVAAARAGAKVTFIGACGADDFGVRARESLNREGVDTRFFVTLPDQPSGAATVILAGKDRQNMIAVANGANEHVPLETIRASETYIAGADLVMAQLETPLDRAELIAELAEKHGKPFLLNPAPALPLPDSLLRRTFVLTPNEMEAEHLTGEKNLERAAEQLRSRGCRNVVITLGEQGCLLLDDGGLRYLAAPKIEPVDTVGAGDCFSGWLAVLLAEGWKLEAASKLAMEAASLSVTRNGAQPGMPSREEMTKIK